MARKGISYDMVANAAAAIKARGQEPTIAASRIEMGNEGSFSTISQHLAKWRELDAEKVDIKSLPEEVENAALVAITQIWNVSNKAAREEIQAIKQDAKDQKKKLQADFDELLAENKMLEELLNKETENNQADKKLYEAQEKKLTAVNSELSTIKKLYEDLINDLKQQAATTQKGGGTKSAHPSKSKPAPENKPAASPEKK